LSLTTTSLRALHDVGLAAWFGGGLMGAVGVNSTARRADNLSDRHQLSAHPWERWAPVNAAAVGAHLVGTAGLFLADRETLAREAGARRSAMVKGGLTAAAVALTVLAERRADLVERQSERSGQGPDEPGNLSPGDFAHAQDELRVLRWAVTGLTGGVLVLGAVQARRSTQ
jgi:hypothetical protein